MLLQISTKEIKRIEMRASFPKNFRKLFWTLSMFMLLDGLTRIKYFLLFPKNYRNMLAKILMLWIVCWFLHDLRLLSNANALLFIHTKRKIDEWFVLQEIDTFSHKESFVSHFIIRFPLPKSILQCSCSIVTCQNRFASRIWLPRAQISELNSKIWNQIKDMPMYTKFIWLYSWIMKGIK